MSQVILNFPSQNTIISYLENHPLTNTRYLKEKKIINFVASFFANSKKMSSDIKTEVMNILLMNYEIVKTNTNINASALKIEAIIDIALNLSKALEDCAKGKAKL